MISFFNNNHQLHPFIGRTDAVDAADGRHHDDVRFSAQQGARRPQPQSVDLVVHGGIFLNVRIGRRDIGFRLVVIIITDKKLDMVFRKEALELCIQLCRERLIVGHDQHGLVDLVNDVRNREGLSASRNAEKGLEFFAATQPFN